MTKEELQALKDAAIDGSDGRVRKANKEVLKNSVEKLDKAILEYDNKALKVEKKVVKAADGGISYEELVKYAQTHHITVEDAKKALYKDK